MLDVLSTLDHSNPDGFEVTKGPRYLVERMAKGKPRDLNHHFSS